MSSRQQQLEQWLNTTLKLSAVNLVAMTGDASFRSYYRLQTAKQSYIIMDAPPEVEDSHGFVAIAKSFAEHGLYVPHIYHANLDKGFLVLSDLGDDLYQKLLSTQTANELYRQAMDSLIQLQQCTHVSGWQLPVFDYAYMLAELENFNDWFLQQYHGIKLSTAELQAIKQAYDFILKSAVEQPQVCIHRDYHSRNLLKCPQKKLGILDFQDAMIGPVTYDLVSLLKDCYIDWPEDQVQTWALEFHATLMTEQYIPNVSPQQFIQWFNLMGVQRHLKAAFIFVRKYIRDRDPSYLKYLPRTLTYIEKICEDYPELMVLRKYLKT